MRSTQFLGIATFVFSLAATGLALQAELSADEIIQRHITALGGGDKIAKVHATVVRGTYREGTYVDSSGMMAKMRPYYKTLADPKDLKVDVNEGYDGSSWEYYSDPGVVLRTVGAAAAASRHGLDLIDDLVDRTMEGATVALAGEEVFAGKPAYCLRVTLADGFEKEVLVDRETFLIIGERRSMKVHAFGQEVTSFTRIGDYRRVNGVLFPFSFNEVDTATGRELNSLTLREVAVNPPLDSNFFHPPQFQHTELQTFLEGLYAERADRAAVSWSYRVFTGAHPDTNTQPGVEFIGYQMLKMGDTRAAIELLTANLSDHPRSASAEFGLGRAYKTSGNKDEARLHFERALQIDPKFKKATEGLDALR